MEGARPIHDACVGPSYLDNVPDEILEAIFIHLETRELLATAQYVCKSWHTVISRPSIWRKMCERHGLADPLTLRGVDNYRAFFLSLSRNLLKNAWATQKLKYWTRDIDSNSRGSRDGFKVETCFPEAVGSAPLPEEARREFARSHASTVGGTEIKCWATTYTLCEKSQLIDLVQVGLDPGVMKSVDRPDISVSVWTAARRDCASIYVLRVRLLKKDNEVLDHVEKTVDVPQWSDGNWEKVTHLFSPVPLETKYVEFIHNGKDQQFWAGHYGPKFTGAIVKLVFKTKSNPKSN